MLSVLLSGTLSANPEERFDRRNQPFTSARMTVVDAEGAAVMVSLIAFSPEARDALRRLRYGDDVAIAGHATLNRWEKGGRQFVGLDVKANRVLSSRDAGVHLTPQERAQRRESAAREAVGGTG
jgi:hypothetical protein